MKSINELLASKTAVKILSVLFDHPLEEFKEISLIRSANTGKGAASDFINRLIKERFVLSKRVGRTKIIKLNLNESSLLLKFFFDNKRLERLPKNVLASIKLLRNETKQYLFLMIVFGSYVAGSATEESDIDILIITEDYKQVNEMRKKVEELFGKKINLHIFNKSEIFEQKKNFIKNALFNGIVIYGYDFAISFLEDSKKESFEKIEYLLDRYKSALKNYMDADYETANYIIQNIIEQAVFFILSEKNVSYMSRKDAMQSIKKLPDGKVIENIKRLDIKQKMKRLEKFLIELYIRYILGEHYDA